jgi:hypothetical protein
MARASRVALFLALGSRWDWAHAFLALFLVAAAELWLALGTARPGSAPKCHGVEK